MDELALIDKLCAALKDETWNYLRLEDEKGSAHDLSRLDVIDYLATLAPELSLPPSALH